jgi:hypothetical protein
MRIARLEEAMRIERMEGGADNDGHRAKANDVVEARRVYTSSPSITIPSAGLSRSTFSNRGTGP